MKYIATFLILLFAVGLAVAGWTLWQQGPGGDGNRRGFGGPVSVEVVHAEAMPFDDRLESVGTVRASESVTLTARVSDTVSEVLFEDGDLAQKGQVLIRLTADEEAADLEEAEAILREAQQQLERDEELIRRGNATQARLDESRREVAAARSRLAAARARVSDRTIKAPFDGLLGLRRVSPGTLISPGTEITTLDDVTPVLVDFSVPERFLSAVAEGQRIEVYTPAYPNRRFEGEVATVASRIDPLSRAVTVRAELPNEDKALRPGMLMTVTLISNARSRLGVPESALVPVSDRQYLFVVGEDGRVERREVKIGARRPGLVEVVDGLAPGEPVVSAGTLRLRPGAEVRIMKLDGQTPAPTDGAAASGA